MESLENIVKEKNIVYEKHYKLLTFLSISLLIIAITYLVFYYISTGQLFKKDISLTGGTTLALFGDYDKALVEKEFNKFTSSYIIKYTRDSYSGKVVATIIESSISDEQAKQIASNLNAKDYSIEITSPSLGKNFFKQLQMAIAIAFVFMSIVVFLLFRSFIPSLAVILAALTDIIVTLAIANIIGLRISTAGIVAFLMLIGYSVDTDIMLTTKVLKRRDEKLSLRLLNSLKTGLMMSGTSLIAVLVAFIFSTSFVLKEIFLILAIGIGIDMISTWIGNASIITWYVKKKYNE